MNNICSNIERITSGLPDSVKLIAVSKTKPNEAILEAYEGGQRIFGENKVQELADKHEALPKDIQWHMIGHLQSNKVKYIAPFVSLIHAVDGVKLLKEINKRALQNERVIDCLLQVKIAKEESKFGLSKNDLINLIESEAFSSFKNIRIVGLMGMATFTNDQNQIREEFKTLKSIFDELSSTHFQGNDHFQELSMGMSGDYPIAVEEGSTMIRVGSSIFGARNYH